jgi:hypothetical protein
MTQQHPITPPPELVKQWREQAPRCRDGGIAREDWLMTRAAQWGADQELEACCEWLVSEPWFKYEHEAVEDLRAARRSKPLSLKEQALTHLESFAATFETFGGDSDLIRRALEQLDD